MIKILQIIILGAITQFATKENTVRKWVLGRSFQAKHAEALIKIADITTTSASPRKCLRESEVMKSDTMVENVKDTLKNHFINPFHGDLEDDQLYNLVSGYVCTVASINLVY